MNGTTRCYQRNDSEKIPDKRVRNVWIITADVQNNILYGISGNNAKFLAVAGISPKEEVKIIK